MAAGDVATRSHVTNPRPNHRLVALAGKGDSMIKLFRAWDRDSDGKVSKGEFRDAVLMLKLGFPSYVIDRLFDHLDTDRTARIEYKELAALLKRTHNVEKKTQLRERGEPLRPSTPPRLPLHDNRREMPACSWAQSAGCSTATRSCTLSARRWRRR